MLRPHVILFYRVQNAIVLARDKNKGRGLTYTCNESNTIVWDYYI